MPSRFLNNITVNDSYTLPSADGTENQIIVTDGAGNLSFDDLGTITGAVTGVESNITYYEVKNSSGSQIVKGKGVMAVGTDGNSGHILIDEMVADGSIEPRYFLGVLNETLNNGDIGRVISFGEVDQINTNGQNGETWSNGQVLWCDPDSAGDFTITEPDGPNVKIPAAFILKASTNGKIQIRVQANEGVKDLYDTKIQSQVDGDVLVWDNTTGVWFNDSTLNVDYTAGNVGIGTTNPNTALEVDGAISTTTSDYAQGATGSRLLLETSGSGNTHSYIQAQSSGGTSNAEDLALQLYGGNVGIGTSSPTSQLGSVKVLDISSVGNSEIILDHTDAGANSDIGLYSWSRNNDHLAHIKATCDKTTDSAFISFHAQPIGGSFSDTSSNEKMRISSNGNVGIGINGARTKLHVFGTTSSMPSLGAAPSAAQIGGNAFGTLFSTLTSGRGVIQQGRSDGTPTSYDLLLQPVGGNVGIGTSSATSAKLVVAGDVDVWNSTNTLLRSSHNGSYGSFQTFTGGLYGILSLNPGGGNVGIGTISPRTKLHVSGLTGDDDPALGSSTAPFFVSNTANSYGLNIGVNNVGASWLQAQSNTSATAYEMSLNPLGGNVGVGFINPSYKLDINGTGRFTGDLRCLSLIQTSQRDQKKDIADIDKSKAKAIPFKEYKYKSSIDGSERKRYGVVVEDIENDYPELVHTDADGIKGINYIDLLVKRVAELEKELEDISLTPGPKGDTGATGVQGPKGDTGSTGPAGANGNNHLNNVESIAFNEKSGQLEITIKGHKDPFRFNPAK